MATTSVRYAVINAIVTALRSKAALSAVNVQPCYPGDRNIFAETIWIDQVDGNLDIPVMVGGRKEYDDIFNVPVEIRVAGQITPEDCRSRLETLASIVRDCLQDDPTLSGLDGVVSAVMEDQKSYASGTPDGYIGFAEIVINVHTRIL
ncbi:hypothetical protein UFOVP209_23 [uncultured Caudovirales phage]|uniref:Uncharacterized protein n=1 Tax=uncultured Caudovirales phage TaxID=2100421 RepID=A0A6J7WJC4_9CAUD|nr:hypothetical protein UFOVP209_23 [uncultured Caudovirales phage]